MEVTSSAVAPKTTTEKGEEESNNSKKVEKPKETKPSNLITSLEEWNSRGKHASTGAE